MTILAAFRAGCVHRWHTNPWLASTGDRIDGHSARVARVLIAWHPAPSLPLIREALIHDDGEHVVGDIPGHRKALVVSGSGREMEADAVTAIWGAGPALSDADADWLRFADKLDALIWAWHHHAPIDTDGWPEAIEALDVLSERLGIRDRLFGLLQQMRLA